MYFVCSERSQISTFPGGHAPVTPRRLTPSAFASPPPPQSNYLLLFIYILLLRNKAYFATNGNRGKSIENKEKCKLGGTIACVSGSMLEIEPIVNYIIKANLKYDNNGQFFRQYLENKYSDFH